MTQRRIMFPLQENSNKTGSPDCPCINVTIPPDLICKNRTILPYCYPIDFGATCKAHYSNYDKLCTNEDSKKNPIPCYMKWCFVDRKKCFSSNVLHMRDWPPFDDNFLSYTTCGEIHPQLRQNVQERLKNFLAPMVADVVVPGSEYPFNYLETAEGQIVPFNETGDYIKSATFKGAFIDYLEEIRKEVGIKGFSINARSQHHVTENGESMYDAAVHDVQNRLFDVAVSNFWVTVARTKIVPFTVPIYTSNLYLYELHEDPSTDVLLSLLNTFKPFTYSLCIMTACTILIIGLLARFFSNSRENKEDYHAVFETDNWKQGTFSSRCIIVIRLFVDPLIESFLDCFGGSTEVRSSPSSMKQKIVAAGFAFFILILQSSYTANLATFLTNRQGNLLKSIDEAIVKRKQICTPIILIEELKVKYPKHKIDTFVPVGDPILLNAIDFMKKRKCDAFIEEHTTLVTGAYSQDVCDGDVPIISSIKTVALKIDMAFPVQPHLASYLSQNMMALKERGITLEKFLDPYMKTFECKIYVNEGPRSLSSEALKFTDMSFPILILTFCMLIGICIKFSRQMKNRSLLANGKIELPSHKTN